MTYFFCKMILPRSDFIQTMTDSEKNIMKAHGDYLQSLVSKYLPDLSHVPTL
jgi:hypothetical protein